jgi:hypothetical protein
MKKWINLEEVIKTSFTQNEVLKKLGKQSAGGNYTTLKKQIEFFNIDISHFNSKKIRIEKLKTYNEIFGKRKDTSEYLIENSEYSRTHLKKRLYKEGLKEKFCELCGQGEIWNGKKLSLILDHINGINNDNRLENLRIVCPNCNSTLDTHCGKNKYSNNKKIKLEKKIKSYVNRRKVKERPDYDTLHIEVNNMGYSAAGRKYGVSDNTIRKWIKSYIKENE